MLAFALRYRCYTSVLKKRCQEKNSVSHRRYDRTVFRENWALRILICIPTDSVHALKRFTPAGLCQ